MLIATRNACLLLTLGLLLDQAQAAPIERGSVKQASPAAADPHETQLTQGFVALQAGQWQEAERQFGAVLKKRADHPRALAGMAQALLKLDRADEAGRRIEQARKSGGNDPLVLLAAARYEAFRGRLEPSLALYRQVEQLTPKDPTPHADMGDLLLHRMKRPADAVKSYQRAVALAPQQTAPRFGLAMALVADKRPTEALDELAKAEALAPQDPNPPYMRGRLLAAAGKFDAAIQAMSLALARDPQFLAALNDRADLNAEARNDRQAVADYEALVKLSPQTASLHLKLAMLYQRTDKLDEARSAYLAALQRHDGLALAYNNLAMMGLRQQRDSAERAAWARKAVALAPDVPQFQDTLGQVLMAQGDTSGALSAHRRAVKLDPANPELQLHLADAAVRSGAKDEARRIYEALLARKPAVAQSDAVRERLAALPK
jgi:Flp pilus assembly protein TadD